jgi:hypothetical protein
MQTCHITSCYITFLRWKIILKIIVYIASHSSNHSAHSTQLSHLPPIDVPPCHGLAFLPPSRDLSPPLLKCNPHCFPSPPPFQLPVPLQLWSRRIKDPPSASIAFPPDPFPTRPPAYKRHRESRCHPPHSSSISSQWRRSSAIVHLCLPTDFAIPPAHAVDGEHRITSLYLIEVPQLATVAHNGRTSSSVEPRHHQWTPGPRWTGGLTQLLGLQSTWARYTTFPIDSYISI